MAGMGAYYTNMINSNEVVFLFDVDNTLLDSGLAVTEPRRP